MSKKKNKKNHLFVNPAPHVVTKDSVPKIMWIVFISLLPAGIWGVYWFGWAAFRVIFVSVAASMITEVVFNKIRIMQISVWNGSAALTGLLIAYILPPYVPLYIPIVASIFAIGVVKHLFGGLGNNIVNPALAGRVFVMFSWIGPMTASKYFIPTLEKSFYLKNTAGTLAAISSATPLGLMKNMIAGKVVSLPGTTDLLIGKIGGSIGEVSALFLIIGAIWLFKRKYITWHLPVPFIGSVAFVTFLYGLATGVQISSEYSLFKNALVFSYMHLIGGGLILGAFYMLTDMVTSPLTRKGQIIMAVGAGLLTAIIRLFGGYPEGVMFAILLMNIIVPLIDRISRPKIYGWEVKNEN